MKCIILICLGAVGFCVVECKAAEVKFQPSLAVSEEFNDNIFLTQEGKVSEFITHVLPGFSLNYTAPALTSDIIYTFDYRHYARGSHGDEITHVGNAKGELTVLENFLFVDIADSYQRVSLDVARDTTQESPFLNQSDQNIFTVSPYFVWHPGTQTTLKTGYSYIDTWYRDPTAVGKKDHNAFIYGTRELSPHSSIDVGYTYTNEQTSISDFNRHNGYAGFRYVYGEGSFINAQGGGTYYKYNDGRIFTSPFWNAGITHAFGEVTAQLGTSVNFTEDPLHNTIQERDYFGKVNKKFQRGNANLQIMYSEFEDTRAKNTFSKRMLLGFGGVYEFTSQLKGTLDISGERFTQLSSLDFPYRVIAKTGASYDIKENFFVSLNYSHETNFRHANFDSPDIGVQVNRVVLELRKTF